jgi:hypothetical protein
MKSLISAFLLFSTLTVSMAVSQNKDGTPISLFQIDFDLTADSAVAVASQRLNCTVPNYWDTGYGSTQPNKKCTKNGTDIFRAVAEGDKLSSITFYCPAFDGCGYSRDELEQSLTVQKNLKFSDKCTFGDLGEMVCVLGDNSGNPRIVMYREKFRAKTLSFD